MLSIQRLCLGLFIAPILLSLFITCFLHVIDSLFFHIFFGGGYFLSLYIAGASKDRMKEKKRELTVGENER